MITWPWRLNEQSAREHNHLAVGCSACRLRNVSAAAALVKTMPRYFFNLTNGDSVADEVGEEFDRVAAARGHAMEVARELSRHRLADALIGRHISVTDERGVVVFKVPL
jgi:hypothetical protein